jgi:hypothetical protein
MEWGATEIIGNDPIFPMDAERLILETDAAGNLKQVPKLPPNKQLEVIVLVIADVDGWSSSLSQGSLLPLEVANENSEDDSSRMVAVQKIDNLRLRLHSVYGEFSDATPMLRDDRERSR